MKLAICGTRTFDVTEASAYIMNSWMLITHHFGVPSIIISGGAPGVDAAAERLAVTLTGECATIYPADWNKHGKAAGPIRNEQIARAADGLLLIWDERSKGSHNVLQAFLKLNKPVLQICIT